MKKTLLKVFGVLTLAVTMVLASCSTDASNISSQIDTVLTLQAPVVKVTAYPGMNYVSWKPVANANKYQVYIYEDDHFLRASSQLSSSALNLKDTEIKNGARYTYIVEAESKSSTGRSVVTENAKSSEVSVTAIVPDYNVKSLELNNHEKGINSKGNEKFVIAADNIHVARDGFDKFSISFPSKAYLNYDVVYSIGNEQSVWGFERAFDTAIKVVDNATNDKIAYTKATPITTSGKYSVAVKANAENEHFGTSDYVVSAEVIDVEELIGSFGTYALTEAKYKNNGAKARITFPKFTLKDESIAPASYYKVYRSSVLKPYDYTLVEGTVTATNDAKDAFYIEDSFGEALPNDVDYWYTLVVTDGKKFAGPLTSGGAPRIKLSAYALAAQTNATTIAGELECWDDDAISNDIVWTITTPATDVVITGVYTLEKPTTDKDSVAASDFDRAAEKNLASKLIKKANWNTGDTAIVTNNNVYTLYDANHTVGTDVYILVTTSKEGYKDAEYMKDSSNNIVKKTIKPITVTGTNLSLTANKYDNTQAANNLLPVADRTENDVIINVTDKYTIGKDKAANYTYKLYRATSTWKKVNSHTAANDPSNKLYDIAFSVNNDWVSVGTFEMKSNNAYDTNATEAEYKGVIVDTANLADGYYVYKVIKSDKAETAGNYVTDTATISISTADEIEFTPTLTATPGESWWNNYENATENIILEFTKANTTTVGNKILIPGHEDDSYPAGYVSETIETGAEYKLYRAIKTAGQTEQVFELVASFTNGQPQYSAEKDVYEWSTESNNFATKSTTYKYITSYKYTYIDTSKSTANSYSYVIVVSKPGCDDKKSNIITITGAN